MFRNIFLLLIVLTPTLGKVTDFNEQWGYVEVREDAHMFWWLYSVPDSTRPLIIWLQGGPGASSTGYGNFEEIGPQHTDWSYRNTTWLKFADLLFIDNPVGTGYSYVENNAYARNISQVAADLVALSISFLAKNPLYQHVPLYIFCESYGGKMTAAYAQVLLEAVDAGKLTVNLQGIGLGDSWISPIDYVNTWGEYLYALSFVGNHSLQILNKQAAECQKFIDNNKWWMATKCWSIMEDLVEREVNGVSFYNILQSVTPYEASSKRRKARKSKQMTSMSERIYYQHMEIMRQDFYESLGVFMNTQVRKKLGIIPKNVTWGGQSSQVFTFMQDDFMKPVVNTVDQLLADARIQVIVYNGQFDLICDTLGTEQWMAKLTWPYMKQFNDAKRSAINLEKGGTALFYRSYKTLTFYWIMDAGHMVPVDNPEAASIMLNHVLNKTGTIE